ncbi:1-acyl-sn-glycerol-3-phosphate acyltransferase [Gossypium arboreum]|uniref:Uncharacterized protein n=2 Tax=Gossypium arboreum TaxID=29729 RepID=A0ABR0R0G6_GOSAR|nr:hypothetical protein PVK06_000884 [Gossypium arboreum]KHG04186.1 1-acyl-sn-glycerol-3-phosphate acyltransferase [Gossypium arboreum]
MENSASGSFLRNRRLESFLETKSGPNVRETQKIPSKQVITRQRPNKTDAFVDDDGWIPTLISCVRIVTCFLAMMVTTFIWAIVMLMLLPWPSQRIRQGNIYGHVTGRLLMWILGNPLKIEGTEFSNERAIYICNHASPIDIFLIMWLTPTGTVGIAKKEIIWYPLFGQLYVLANHLRIDRSDPRAAIKSMKRVRVTLQGFVHLAIESGLPIVPIILTGTHLAWRKGSLHVRPAPISVKYLPPIKTDSWTADNINDYIKMVHDIYVENLPEAQKPISTDDTKNSSRS